MNVSFCARSQLRAAWCTYHAGFATKSIAPYSQQNCDMVLQARKFARRALGNFACVLATVLLASMGGANAGTALEDGPLPAQCWPEGIISRTDFPFCRQGQPCWVQCSSVLHAGIISMCSSERSHRGPMHGSQVLHPPPSFTRNFGAAPRAGCWTITMRCIGASCSSSSHSVCSCRAK